MSTENTGSDREEHHLLRVARITVGIVFLILGVIGSLLPILQGWMFFLLALITFFPGHPRVAAFLDRVEPKAPRTVHLLRKLGIGVDVNAHHAPEKVDPEEDGVELRSDYNGDNA